MAFRSPRVGVVLLLAAAATVALSVGAEVAYRARSSRRGGGRSVQVRFYDHRRLDRALVRDVDYGGVVHINRLGFRGPDFELAKPAGVTRVVVVGASTTFDPCARSDEETWAARLEHWLGELAPDRTFQVVNAGVPGFPMDRHVTRLHTELYALEPDVFVVYAGHGIVSAEDVTTSTSTTPDAAPSTTPWGSWLDRHSRLYAAVRARMSRSDAVPSELGPDEWAHAVDEAAGDFRRDLTSFVAIARSLDAEVMLVEINRVTGRRAPEEFTEAERAAWERLFATPPEVVYAGYQQFGATWREVADEFGATFVSADSLGIEGAPNFCEGDPIHFNAAGSEAMGRRLAEAMLARGL